MIMKIFEKKYLSELFKLALPIIMGNLGIILLGAADCFVAGRYSTSALAAISIATSIHATLMMFGIGLSASISPLLSNKRGEKIPTKRYFYPTIRFALVTGVLLMFATFAYIPLLDCLGYEQQLLADVKIYTFIVAFSAIGAVLNVALKEFLQAYEIVFLPNFLTIMSVVLDLILNYIFVFGLFGFPEMGVAGIALATTIVRTLVALLLLAFCLWKFKFIQFEERDYYKQIIKIGLPISMAIMIEFLAFNYIAIILGKISGLYAAAHNVILVISSASFMIPMGISNALAVKVGFANGAKNYDELLKYIINGVGFSILFMAGAGAIFALFPAQLSSIFTPDKHLVSIIVPVMYIVALFQITDGIQASLGGVYKGLKRTKFVMFANIIGYLLISVSLGTYLGVMKKMYLFGCWVAIAISSVILSTILVINLCFILKSLNKEFAKL